jgi:hypothetical protein
MHPLLKRILINGGLTAAVLAGVGFLFAQMASTWTSGEVTKPDAAAANNSMIGSIRSNVPMMMAFWGFMFVSMGEVLRWCLWGRKPTVTKPVEKRPDDTEKLLNELLAQAESRMATEQELGDRGQGIEQKADGKPTEERN